MMILPVDEASRNPRNRGVAYRVHLLHVYESSDHLRTPSALPKLRQVPSDVLRSNGSGLGRREAVR